jgi:hypothetical protein
MTNPKVIRRGIDIDADASVVWPYLARFHHWPAWGPTVTAVESASSEVAPGVTGRVRTPIGLWLPFTIVDVDPGRAWDWRVAGVPATGHTVVPDGPSRCRVEFTAPWWASPYAAVLAMGLRRIQRLAEQHEAPTTPSA